MIEEKQPGEVSLKPRKVFQEESVQLSFYEKVTYPKPIFKSLNIKFWTLSLCTWACNEKHDKS